MNPNQPQPNKFTYPLEIRDVEEDVLFTAPDGWIETNISYKRSKVYGGVIRGLSLPIKYVKRGAYLVRNEFAKYGIFARINQKILQQDPLTWENNQLFFGKLDFSKYSDEPTGVSVTLVENNINTQVAAFGDQPYTVPLNVNTTQRNAWIAARGYDPMVDILLTPLQLEETADMIFNTTPDFRMNAFFQLSIADYQQMSVNPSVIGTGFLFQAPPVFAFPANNFFAAQTDTKIRFNSPIDPVTGLLIPGAISTSINGKPGSVAAQYQFNIYNQAGTLLKTIAETPVVTTTVEFTFDFDFSLSVSKGDKLYFYIVNILDDTYGSSDTGHGVNIQGGSMSLTYFTSTPASHCQALRPAYVFDYLVQQMNGTENPQIVTQSFLLDGPLFQACITCSNAILTSQVATIYQAGDNLQIGDTYKVFGGIVHYVDSSGNATDYGIGSTFKALLAFPTFTTDPDQDGFVQQENNNPQLLLSFNTLFKAFYGVQGAQCGVGLDPVVNKYCMEDLRYFYRPTPTSATPNMAALDLGTNIDINSPRLEVSDLCVNAIKGGYADPQLTALNGGQEVNSSVAYGTLITSVIRTLDITVPINASCYAIEEKRIQPGFNQPTQGLSGTFYLNSAASRSDNDNHFVWVGSTVDVDSGFYQPLTVAQGCTSFAGVDGSFYNWPLTPKQNLLRGTNYLASIFDKVQGQIALTQAKKNASLVTVDLNGRRVAEADVVNIADLGPQMFLPYYDNIVTGLQFNAEQMLSLKPFSEIWYTYRGVVWKSFIQEISVDKGANSPQSFKVLLAASNDLSLRVF